MKEQLAAIGIPPVYTPLHEALEKIVKRTEKVEKTFKKHSNTDEEKQVESSCIGYVWKTMRERNLTKMLNSSLNIQTGL